MSRRCEITGKGPLVGHKVSHANNKTKRRFLPNLQDVSFFSTALKRNVKVTASTNGIRTIEHKGGIDAYLVSTAPTKLLTPALRRLRKLIVDKAGPQEKPAPKKRRPVSPVAAVKKAKKAAKRKATAQPKKKAA